MAIVQTTNKWTAVRAFINTWLKDPTWYCNNCGKVYGTQIPKPPFSCCDGPQVGRNIDHTYGVVRQNKLMQQTRKNDFASDDDKTIRWGISIPPDLFRSLEKYFKDNYQEKLINNKKEFYEFMKEFPEFRICRKI